MAFIGFMPNPAGSSCIEASGFEQGFNVSQENNCCSFSGEWECPVNPEPAKFTQNLVCVCEATSNCVMITVTYEFREGKGTLHGWMTVTPPTLPFAHTGIDEIARNGAPIHVFPSGATGPETFIRAPYLDGRITVASF